MFNKCIRCLFYKQLHRYPTEIVEIYFVVNVSVNTFALLSSKQILIKKDRGIWPCEVLATISDDWCYIHPEKER